MINETVLLLLLHGCGNWIFVFVKMQNVLADFAENKRFLFIYGANGATHNGAFVLFTD